jgi:hypothetical protein
MKTIKYLVIMLAISVGLSSCVVRVHNGPWVPAHYEYGPYGGRHWVPGHYA